MVSGRLKQDKGSVNPTLRCRAGLIRLEEGVLFSRKAGETFLEWGVRVPWVLD